VRENAENLNTQAIELASQGEYPEAIACFKRAITMENSNYLLWYNLGVTYRDAGDLKHAKTAVEHAYSIDGTDQEVLETLAVICYTLGNRDEALQYCAEGLQQNDQNAHLWNTLGVVYFNRGTYDDACTAFEHAVTINPYYYDALFNLRDTYAEQGNETGRDECSNRMRQINGGGINNAR
jgi:tetratricopeptide (TPR) repeat protein